MGIWFVGSGIGRGNTQPTRGTGLFSGTSRTSALAELQTPGPTHSPCYHPGGQNRIRLGKGSSRRILVSQNAERSSTDEREVGPYPTPTPSESPSETQRRTPEAEYPRRRPSRQHLLLLQERSPIRAGPHSTSRAARRPCCTTAGRS